jgi:FkbM family methyltransferase
MCWHPDGQRLVISYGVLDREAWVATVDANAVCRLLGMDHTAQLTRLRSVEAVGSGYTTVPAITLTTEVCDDPPIALFHTATGDWWLPTNAPDDLTINAMRRGEVYDQWVVDTARRFAKPGSTMIDVGSCFGQMSSLFGQMVGPGGKVLAFEADPFLASLTRRNNSHTSLQVFQTAAWHSSGQTLRYPKADLIRFYSYGSYGITPRAETGRAVHSTRIDDLVMPGPVSFMKVDVQGSDLFAMQGARETIRKHRMPIVFEFEAQFQDEFGTSWAMYEDFIREIGYRITEQNGPNSLIEPEPEHCDLDTSLYANLLMRRKAA